MNPKRVKSAYWVKPAGAWRSRAVFSPPTGVVVEEFGKAVSKENGLVAIVGHDKAANLDRVYFYEQVSGSWQLTTPRQLESEKEHRGTGQASTPAASVPEIASIDLAETSPDKYALFVGTHNSQKQSS